MKEASPTPTNLLKEKDDKQINRRGNCKELRDSHSHSENSNHPEVVREAATNSSESPNSKSHSN